MKFDEKMLMQNTEIKTKHELKDASSNENSDEILDKMILHGDVDFEKKIAKIVDRRIRRITFSTVAVIVLVFLIVKFVVSPLFALNFTNPAKADKTNSHVEQSKLEKTLDIWAEINFPTTEIFSIDVEDKGFGIYNLSISTANLFEGPVEIGATTVKMRMKLGKLEIVDDPKHLIRGTYDLSEVDKEEWSRRINHLKGINDTDTVRMRILLDKPEKYDEIKKKLGKSEVEWLSVQTEHSDSHDDFMPGLALFKFVGWSQEDTRRKKLSGKELYKIYESNMKALRDNFELIDGLEFWSANKIYAHPKEIIEDCIKNFDKDRNLETEYLVISGTKSDIMKYLESGDVKGFELLYTGA